MRVVAFDITEYPPIRRVSVEELADIVVFGGPNGVGKTKLLEALLQKLRIPTQRPEIRLQIEATNPKEVREFGGRSSLDTANPEEANLLQAFLQKKRRRGRWLSGVLNFDSSRAFEEVKPYGPIWEVTDPFDEDIGFEVTYGRFKDRFRDTIHSLHKKLHSLRDTLGRKALEANRRGEAALPLGIPDPLAKFKEAFSRLLPGKALVELDERHQAIRYRTVGIEKELALQSLSSGEREVVGIVFDFLLRDPADCVVVFDEPELHLHPELSYRLLHTLREAGDRNQFIFCTHSADIISASLEHTVVFISPPDEQVGGGKHENQVRVVTEDSEAAHVLSLLGQSLGIVALGRRIVLIEGERASLDKQTYGAILGDDHPELVLVPGGGRDRIEAFARAIETVLRQTIWGIEFFALCDGDATVNPSRASQLEEETDGRLRKLPRYHLENYFLEPTVLASVFRSLGDDPDSWLLDPDEIESRLRDMARPYVSVATALRVAHEVRMSVGNVNIVPKACNEKTLDDLIELFRTRVTSEHNRVEGALNLDELLGRVAEEFELLNRSLDGGTDEWKALIPGRPILASFAGSAKLNLARLKTLYLRAARTAATDPFREIREIFDTFAAQVR